MGAAPRTGRRLRLLLLVTGIVLGAAILMAMPGDIDGDTDVDVDDIALILAARNTPASGPSDPRDLDADGVITVLDARIAVVNCTRPLCVVGNNPPTVTAPGDQTIAEDGTTGALPVLVDDPDIGVDPNTLVLSATSSNTAVIPDGNLVLGGAGNNRTVTVTPAPDANGGPVTIDLTVSDGIDTATDSFTVTVTPVNDAPVLAPIGPQAGDELTLISFTATANDPDVGDVLTFTLVDGTGMVPPGAAIDPNSGVFTFTPTEDQDGVYSFDVVVTDDGAPTNLSDSETITVTVADVNSPPTLAPIGAQSGDEQTPIAFTAMASDSDLPVQTLSFSLQDGVGGAVPAGAAIDPGTGDFTWTPTEAQGPGVYTFDVVVTDDGINPPNLMDSETITVTVDEANVAPVLDPIGNQTVDELTQLSFVATATDADLPANTLTFSLDVGAPAGASIDPSSGAFTFTPSEAQGPGLYPVTVRVTDDGTPALDDFETFDITVAEVNVAPVLDPIGNQTVDELTLLSFNAMASDADLPANTLTFTLDAGAPAGAGITTGGLFTWTPSEAQGPGVYPITVRVTDDGVNPPSLDDSETFNVTVNEVNDPPVAVDDSYQTVGNTALEVNNTAAAAQPSVFVLGDVLDNDSDGGDGPAALTASLIPGSVTAGASVVMQPDGTFVYSPPAGQTADDTFQYNVSDGADMAMGTVTVQFTGQVWYVDDDAAGSDVGTSTDPFDTLAEAQAASGVGDTIFVFTDSGTALDETFTLQDQQRLIGEGVDLTFDAALNGSPAPATLYDSVANVAPMITRSTGAAIVASDVSALIQGFDVTSADASAIDVDTTAGSHLIEVRDNVLLGSTGGHGLDVVSGAGVTQLELRLTDNAVASSDDDGAGTLYHGASIVGDPAVPIVVSELSGLQVPDSASSVGNGLFASDVDFDADPGTAGLQPVSAGALSVGDSGGSNRAMGAGVRLTGVRGTLSFSSVDVFNDLGTGIEVSNPGFAAADFTLEISAGSVDSGTARALDLDPMTSAITLGSLSGSSVRFDEVAGVVTASGGALTNASATPAFEVTDGTVSVTYGGSITQTGSGAAVSVGGNHTLGTLLFQTGTIGATNGTGLQFSNADGVYTFNGTANLGGGDAGVDIVAGSGGTFTFADTTITSPTGTAFRVDSSTAGVSYVGGSITQNNVARGVHVTGHATGTLTFAVPITVASQTVNAIEIAGAGTVGFSAALDLDTTDGNGFDASNVANLAVTGVGSSVDVSGAPGGAGGIGVRLQSSTIGAPGVTFATVNVGASGDASGGVVLSGTGSAGAFTVSGGTIQNIAGATGRGFDAADVDGTVTISASIENDAGRSVEIDGGSVGSITFNGAIDDNGAGIRLASNTGGTATFRGGMALDTGANTAFSATGGGTVNVCATSLCGGGGSTVINTIGATTALVGRAVEITDTTIGASGVTFRSIAVNQGSTAPDTVAIVLDDTGAGTFTVTGDGTTSSGGNGSGGTIENLTDVDAITLNNTDGRVTLQNVILEDIAHASDGADNYGTRRNVDGIHGQSVDGGLTLQSVTLRRFSDNAVSGSLFADGISATPWNGLVVNNAVIEDANRYHVGPSGPAGLGDDSGEGGIRIIGLSGTVTVSNSTFSRTAQHLDFWSATSGSLALTVTGNTFNTTTKEFNCSPPGTVSVGKAGISLLARGSTSVDAVIGGAGALANSFTDNNTASLVIVHDSGATGEVDTLIANNTFRVVDHLTGPSTCPGGSLQFFHPQGGVYLGPRGGQFDAIVEDNLFDEVMHADGGLGQLTIVADAGGSSDMVVRDNTFRLPWDASVRILADANGSARVLFHDNTYVDGTVGSAGDDVGFVTQSPFNPWLVNVRNGGSLDLRLDGSGPAGEVLPQHDDVFSIFPHSFDASINVSGGTFDLWLDDVVSPDGYRFDIGGGTLNLYSETGCPLTPAQIVDGNGNTGGMNSDATDPPTVVTVGGGTIACSTTQPTVPNPVIP